MAKTKELPKHKQIEVRETVLPGGITDSVDSLKDYFGNYKNNLSTALASFFVGKASDGKTDTSLGSKANSYKNSILGNNNSIYSLLLGLNKKLERNIGLKLKGISSNISDINTSLTDTTKGILLHKVDLIDNGVTNIVDKFDEIIPKLDLYKDTISNLFEINKQLKEDKEKNIVNAKLKLALEGINSETIQSFIEFSNINFDQLDKNGEALTNFFNSLKILENLNTVFTDISSLNQEDVSKLITNIGSIQEVINTINTIKINKTTYNVITKLVQLFSDNGESINSIFDILKTIQPVAPAKVSKIAQSISAIQVIISGINSISDDIKDIDTKKVKANIKEYITLLKDIYTDLKTELENIIATGELAKKIDKSNKQIEKALDSSTETAIKTSKKGKEIQESKIAIEGLNSFMITAAIVMTIGAFIVMLGGGKFVKAALEFGLVLAAFEALVIAPALMFASKKEEAIQSLNEFNGFIITCAFTLMVGAAVMMLGGGKFAQNALLFGLTLGLFEALIIIPFRLFGKVSEEIGDNIRAFTLFVISSTIVMSIGALFMAIGGGKYAKNALMFGVTLMAFEAVVIAPFILFGLVKGRVYENVKQFIRLVIKSTIIMSIGALFVYLGGGKFIKSALKFGLVLMAFEALIIAPFLLFNLIGKNILKGLKSFTICVITCTIIMSIGALFVSLGGGKFIKNALVFGILLMTFEALVIAPFIIFNKIDRQIFKGLTSFAVVVFVCTTVLLVGALFMTMQNGKMPWAAMEFTGLLALFEAAVVLPILLFNKVKKDALNGVKDFALFIGICAGSLILGALFITKYGVKPVIQFGIILGIFVTTTSVIVGLLSKYFNPTALAAMSLFSLFILSSTAALIPGALFVNKYGTKSVIKYGLLLLGFTVLTGFAIVGLSATFKAAGGEPIVIGLMVALGSFLLVSTAAIVLGALYVEKYGVTSALEYAGLLLGFIIFTGLIFAALTGAAPYIAPGIIVGTMLGVAIMVLSTSLFVLNFMFENDKDGSKMMGNIDTLTKVLFRMSLPFAALSLLAIPIEIGSIVGIAMGASMFVLGSALGIINRLIGEHGQELMVNIGILNDILSLTNGGIGLTFAMLGALTVPIYLGSIASLAMSVALTALSGGLILINNFLRKNQDIKNNIEMLNDLLGVQKGGIGLTFAIMGALAVPIYLGSVSGAAMGVSLMIIGTALLILNDNMNSIKGTILNNIQILTSALQGIALLIGGLVLSSGVLVAALPATYMLNIVTLGITTSVILITTSVKKMLEVGEITDKEIDIIAGNINKFIEIPDKLSFGNPLEIIEKFGKIALVTSMVIPLSMAMNMVAEAVQNMASLTIPKKWDKDGNPIDFRTLNQGDFDLAIDNTGKLITTLADAFYKAYEGDGKEQKGLRDLINAEDSPIWNVLLFSRQAGSVIKSIAEGVGAMAKMQIPIAWDKDGNPISFRQLKDSDFKMAGEGTSKILTSLAYTIGGLYKLGFDSKLGGSAQQNIFKNLSEGNLFTDAEPSPFMMVLTASMKISELVANMGEGISKIATLQIPDQWDPKTGKVIKYRTLEQKDFDLAGEGISSILTSLIGCIGGLYARGKEFDPDHKQNIFDMISGGLFGSDKPSPFVTTLEATLKLSSLIANIGSGIKDMATMQIPNAWNKEGKPISYTKLTSGDFSEAADNIATIITTVAEAVNSIEIDPDIVKNVSESLNPLSEFISNSADGIIKLASGQVADSWNKDGVATHYKDIKPEDYTKAIESIENIITFVAGGILTFAGSPEYKKYFDDNKFKDIVESITSVNQIITGITDSIIKIGQGLVPYKWDKNGKPTDYKQIDFANAAANLGLTIYLVTTMTVKAIVDAYNNGLQPLINGENSPFNDAVKGISGVTQIVGNIVDSLVKLGTAQVPAPDAKWDNGKPSKYVALKVDDTVKNIKEMFDPDNDQSLLKVLCTSIKEIGESYFSTSNKDNNISSYVEAIAGGTQQISSTIGVAAQTIVDIASLCFPTEFNDDGTGKSYQKLKTTDIDDAKTNILSIFNNLFGVVTDESLNDYIASNNDFKNKCTFLNNNVEIISKIITESLNKFNSILEYGDTIKQIFNYEQQSNIKDTELTLGLFNDIYSIISNYNQIKSLISNQSNLISKIVSEEYDQFDKNISTISNSIKNIFDYISDLTPLLSDNKLKMFIDSKENDNIKNQIQNILSIYTSAIEEINKFNDNLSNNGSKNNLKLITLTVGLTSVAITMNTLFKGMGDIYESFYGNVINFKNSISDIITQMDLSETGFSKSLTNLEKNMILLSNIYSMEFKRHGIIFKKSIFNDITDDLQDFVNNGINPFDITVFNKFNKLNDSINKIYDTINKQKHTEQFNYNVESIEKYVSAVNGVEVNKLKPLTDLVVELNKLSGRLGNLDRVTDAIANQLSVVLKDLVDALGQSAETINTADRIQNNRQQKIESAINTIKGLMNQPLNVNVVSANGNDTMVLGTSDTNDPNNSNITINNNGSTGQGGEGQGGQKQPAVNPDNNNRRTPGPAAGQGGSVGNTNK